MSADALGAGDSLLAPDEPPPYEIVNPNGSHRAILTCDHASNRIPRRLGSLGLEAGDLDRHIAWDIGAEAVARRVSDALDATLITAGYSRLVVDCNRPLSVPEAFAARSEATEIPGNAALGEADRQARAEACFWPYQDAVHRVVSSRARDSVPLLISVHSFTPVYLQRPRPWSIGVHYRLDRRLADLALDHLRSEADLIVADNEPYPVALDEDYTVPVHAETRGMPYVLFEIRQDHIDSDAGAHLWADRLATFLDEVTGHGSLGDFGPKATDVHEPRYREGGPDHAAK